MKEFVLSNTKRKIYDPTTKKLVQCKKYSIFKIDFRKVKGLTLFRDNMFCSKDLKTPIAVYSEEPIPPSCIEKVYEFLI